MQIKLEVKSYNFLLLLLKRQSWQLEKIFCKLSLGITCKLSIQVHLCPEISKCMRRIHDAVMTKNYDKQSYKQSLYRVTKLQFGEILAVSETYILRLMVL